MAPRLRRMRTYRPRKRVKRADLHKQALHDIKHKISGDVGALIALIESGTAAQVHSAQQRAKSDFLKHSAEMQHLASNMGEHYVNAVREYLDSVDTLIHSNTTLIDQAKISRCFNMSEKLDQELKAA